MDPAARPGQGLAIFQESPATGSQCPGLPIEFWRCAEFSLNGIVISFWMFELDLENNLKAGRKNRAGELLDELLTEYGADRVINFLREQAQNNFTIPLSSELLCAAIIDKTEADGDEIADMSSLLKDM